MNSPQCQAVRSKASPPGGWPGNIAHQRDLGPFPFGSAPVLLNFYQGQQELREDSVVIRPGYEARRFAEPAVRAGEVPRAGVARDPGHAARVARAASGGSWPAADRCGRFGPRGKSVLLPTGGRKGSWHVFLAVMRRGRRRPGPELGRVGRPPGRIAGVRRRCRRPARDGQRISADVMASIADDAAKMPAGSAIIFTTSITRRPRSAGLWPISSSVASRGRPAGLVQPFRPSAAAAQARMSGELCELRDRDLYFSLAESRDLLANSA